MTLAQQLCHRSIRHTEGLFGAVGLTHGNHKIATVAGRVKVINQELPGVTVVSYNTWPLGHGHPGIGAGDPRISGA